MASVRFTATFLKVRGTRELKNLRTRELKSPKSGDNGRCNSEHWASRETISCAIQKVCYKRHRSLVQNHFLCAVCEASSFIVLAGEHANSLGFWRSTKPKDRGASRRQTCDTSRADDRIAGQNHNSALACATGSLHCCLDATFRRRVARGGLRSRLPLCRVDECRCAVAPRRVFAIANCCNRAE